MPRSRSSVRISSGVVSDRAPIRSSSHHALWLLDLIGARSDTTPEEIRTLLRERGISVSVTTVWSFYDRHGISFTKKPLRHGAGSSRRGPGPRCLEGTPRAA